MLLLSNDVDQVTTSIGESTAMTSDTLYLWRGRVVDSLRADAEPNACYMAARAVRMPRTTLVSGNEFRLP